MSSFTEEGSEHSLPSVNGCRRCDNPLPAVRRNEFPRALGPTQPPIQWLPGALYPAVKRPGCEADHLPPSSAEVKEYVELYLHFPSTSSRRGA
jgi:hypothetical protein